MKKLLLIATLLIGFLTSCNNEGTPFIPEPTIDPILLPFPELDSRTQEAIVKKGNVFANDLMTLMNQEVPDKNMMISPLSIQFVLGMASNGANEEAVRLSGVDVKKWKMLAYVICGLLVGIASIFYVAAYTTVQPGYGDQYNNEAIAGCVMGGTSMAGGIASISGTVIGVLIISLLQQGILALGFTKEYQYIITGLIVIAAVYSDVSARRRKN